MGDGYLLEAVVFLVVGFAVLTWWDRKKRQWLEPKTWKPVASQLGLSVEQTEEGCRIEGDYEGRDVAVQFGRESVGGAKNSKMVYHMVFDIELTAGCWEGFVLTNIGKAGSGVSVLSAESLRVEEQFQVSVELQQRARRALRRPEVADRLLDLADRSVWIRLEEGRIELKRRERLDPDDFERHLRELIEVAEMLDEEAVRSVGEW